jgi:hypothetical protein
MARGCLTDGVQTSRCDLRSSGFGNKLVGDLLNQGLESVRGNEVVSRLSKRSEERSDLGLFGCEILDEVRVERDQSQRV